MASAGESPRERGERGAARARGGNPAGGGAGGENSDHGDIRQPERRCGMHDRRASGGATAGSHLADCGRREVSSDNFIDHRAVQRRRYLADSARGRDSRQGYCRSLVLRQVSKFQGCKVSGLQSSNLHYDWPPTDPPRNFKTLKLGSILMRPRPLLLLAVAGALLLFFGVTGSRLVRAAAPRAAEKKGGSAPFGGAACA